MKRTGVAFPEAVRIVAELSGIVTSSRVSRLAPPSPATASKLPKTAGKLPERSSGLPLGEALSLVTEAADRLWKPQGTEALNYLYHRCLKDETIRAARLGEVHSLPIPAREGDRFLIAGGIVIPWFEGNRLARVKIRQPEGRKPKYVEAFSDRAALYPGPEVIKPGRPLIIPEGELDTLLLAQELHDLAAVVTLGSASSRPDPVILGRMLAAALWFIATDSDKAGNKAAQNWPGRVVRVRPPEPCKDWTEAAQGGINLRFWWAARLGSGALWNELARLRWGAALDDSCFDSTER
jgi:DNA primase